MSSLSLLCLDLLLSASGDFELLTRESDGLVLSARKSSDTDFKELRVQARSAAQPGALAELIWSGHANDDAPYVERREQVSSARGERVERQVLSLPLLGRRDSLVKFERRTEPDGTHVIRYGLEGRPADARGAGMKLLRGEWRLSPRPDGGTDVEYRSLADPGGVPALFGERTQRDVALEVVRDVLNRARSGGAT